MSEGFLDMLGVQPVIGRLPTADDSKPGAPPVAVITHKLWRSVFGGEAEVLGRTVERATTQFTIVGVLPRTFVFPTPRRRFAPEVVTPIDPTGPGYLDRTSRGLFLVGRLAPGTSLQQAQTELDAVALRLKPLFVGRPNVRPGAFDGATLRGLS